MVEDQGKNGGDEGNGSRVMRPERAFLCHSSEDSDFVIKVAQFLERNLEVYYYEEYQPPRESFRETIKRELERCEIFIGFVRNEPTENQINEIECAYDIHRAVHERSFIFCLLEKEFPRAIARGETRNLKDFPQVKVEQRGYAEARRVAKEIMRYLNKPFKCDGLPSNPHLFSYEKDIINHFVEDCRIKRSEKSTGKFLASQIKKLEQIVNRQLDGCPVEWPDVVRWDEAARNLPEEYVRIGVDTKEAKNRIESWKSIVGSLRKKDDKVIVAALTDYHKPEVKKLEDGCCLVKPGKMCFPEAGPRDFVYFPRIGRRLRVAILVSGGIAPGTNAVIDGIVQRHLLYANEFNYVNDLNIVGIKNGFLSFEYWGDDNARRDLKVESVNTSYRASEGGSLLGTSRVDELLDESDERWDRLNDIISKLYASQVDILYIIGGDGSMKAAHALWTVAQEFAETRRKKARKLSVIAIPKTMDNDILWVWQTFGFLSAVEKAREIIDHLATEVESNPRLCVAQLFGSDSGFVVSHAVLASRPKQCDAALIPEIDFSIRELARHLKKQMSKRLKTELIRRGLVVMAETAIPRDAMDFVDEKRKNYVDIGLTDGEKKEIRKFEELRAEEKRIQGQTKDELRSAGLKIVSRGLHRLLENNGDDAIDSPGLRAVTNEPRHLLRALPPSCTDIIMGNRLGTLAVDNALAGYTDFMVSQWLTEYVLVPLELVVLGRKRIPKTGIFWKSVIAKTGQPAELY